MHLPKFSSLPNDAHRLDYVRRHFLSCIELRPIFKAKSEGEAEDARKEGNELFKAKRFKEARQAYNKSVLRAPKQTAVRNLGSNGDAK